MHNDLFENFAKCGKPLQYSDYRLAYISTLTEAAMESVHHICTLAPLLKAFYPLPFPWSGFCCLQPIPPDTPEPVLPFRAVQINDRERSH